MANFIVINPSMAGVISRIDKISKKPDLEDKALTGDTEMVLGSMPLYGSVSAVLQNYPAIKNYSNRIYEALSRRKLTTVFIEDHNLLIIKMSDKVTAPRTQADTDELVHPQDAAPKARKTKKK